MLNASCSNGSHRLVLDLKGDYPIRELSQCSVSTPRFLPNALLILTGQFWIGVGIRWVIRIGFEQSDSHRMLNWFSWVRSPSDVPSRYHCLLINCFTLSAFTHFATKCVNSFSMLHAIHSMPYDQISLLH